MRLSPFEISVSAQFTTCVRLVAFEGCGLRCMRLKICVNSFLYSFGLSGRDGF